MSLSSSFRFPSRDPYMIASGSLRADSEVSSVSESESDDSDTTDDESDARVSPVSSAFTHKTSNTTEAISAGQSIARGHLTHGFGGPPTERPGSGRNLGGNENATTSDASYADTGDDDESGDSEGNEDSEDDGESEDCEDDSESEGSEDDGEEDDDSAQDAPDYHPSTYVHARQLDFLDFPQPAPLLSLPLEEIDDPWSELASDDGSSFSGFNFSENELADNESSCSSFDSSEDVEGEDFEGEEVEREEVEIDRETGIPIARFPSIYHQVPLPTHPKLSVPPRREGAISYLEYRRDEFWNREG